MSSDSGYPNACIVGQYTRMFVYYHEDRRYRGVLLDDFSLKATPTKHKISSRRSLFQPWVGNVYKHQTAAAKPRGRDIFQGRFVYLFYSELKRAFCFQNSNDSILRSLQKISTLSSKPQYLSTTQPYIKPLDAIDVNISLNFLQRKHRKEFEAQLLKTKRHLDVCCVL